MTTTIEITGSLQARVENDRIVGYTFTPYAADAGYFGPDIIHVEGPEIDKEAFFDMVNKTLMFSYDRQTATFTCEWSE